MLFLSLPERASLLALEKYIRRISHPITCYPGMQGALFDIWKIKYLRTAEMDLRLFSAASQIRTFYGVQNRIVLWRVANNETLEDIGSFPDFSNMYV